MREDEEMRYVLDGSGYFDIRQHDGPNEECIRDYVTTGDLLVVFVGINHRFTLDEENRTKVMRLFKVRFPSVLFTLSVLVGALSSMLRATRFIWSWLLCVPIC